MCFGESQSGPIERHHIQSTFTSSQHAPPDALAKPYEAMTQIIEKAMQSLDKESKANSIDDPRYKEDAIRKKTKLCLLAMQGSWTTQHHYSWRVQNATYDED